ncbi:MAG: PHP domain-containing protein, partial [Succiniclasticum sp.]|nr:PHP domain-containing protein [Succiniclasticum sp.]
MNSKVDLHMHSRASDGSDWIPGLLRKIQKLGIRTFALTDHDTIKGVQRMEKIVPDGIRFIRGIELSCKTEVAKCHILGYNYDL